MWFRVLKCGAIWSADRQAPHSPRPSLGHPGSGVMRHRRAVRMLPSQPGRLNGEPKNADTHGMSDGEGGGGPHDVMSRDGVSLRLTFGRG